MTKSIILEQGRTEEGQEFKRKGPQGGSYPFFRVESRPIQLLRFGFQRLFQLCVSETPFVGWQRL